MRVNSCLCCGLAGSVRVGSESLTHQLKLLVPPPPPIVWTNSRTKPSPSITSNRHNMTHDEVEQSNRNGHLFAPSTQPVKGAHGSPAAYWHCASTESHSVCACVDSATQPIRRTRVRARICAPTASSEHVLCIIDVLRHPMKYPLEFQENSKIKAKENWRRKVCSGPC